MARISQGWSPFRELERFRRDFDDVFNRFLGSPGTTDPSAFALAGPPMESYIEGETMVVRADLPGVDPKDVEITVTGNSLTLRGKRESRREEKNRDFLHREVNYGSFERTITLPEGIRSEDIQASYHNGVLQLSIPIPRELASRRVPIQVMEAGAAPGEGAEREPKPGSGAKAK